MKKLLLATMALAATSTLSARHLTPEEALGRLTGSAAHRVPAAVAQAPRLLLTAKADNLERVYVFGNEARKGFMVLSADDVAPALLAYSDSETIDTQNLPDNIRYWLDEYARQIAYAADNGVSTEASDVKERASVEPKLTTIWDQTNPYFNQSPAHNGILCPTGCVATAVAQIMNWHKWPVKPHGKKTYNSYYIGNLSIDFDQIVFEWDKMLDRYYIDSPQENINAVSTLMMAVGYASEMSYHQKASGATGYNAAIGLFTHFDYNKGMSLENREWYGIEEWEDLVYAELTENGPVYYEGTGDGGGHAFVCDGYDGETGLFHFNWGWTGQGNGYYRLSALNPAVQGTGGNSYGYNYSQDILRNLKKADPAKEEEPVLIMGPAMGIVTPFETAELGAPITLKGYDTTDGFKNYSLVALKGMYFGARFHNNLTGVNTDVVAMNDSCTINPYYKVNIIRFQIPTTLSEGNYTLTPLWRIGEQGEWREMRMMLTTRNYVPVTVKGTTCTFGFGEAEGRVEAKITDAPEYFTTSGSFTLEGTIKSTGTKDYSGLLCAVFMYFDSKGQPQVADQGKVVRYDIKKDDNIEFTYTSTPQNGKLVDSEDTYYIGIGDAITGEIISPVYSIKVGNRFGALDVYVPKYEIENAYYLDPEKVNIKLTVEVSSGEYHGPIAAGFSLKRNPFEIEHLIESPDFDLIAGDSKELTFSGILDGVKGGTLYYVHLMHLDADGEWNNLTTIPLQVLVSKDFSGVDEVAVDSENAAYYDIYGRKVDQPAPGNLYIRRAENGRADKVVF